MGKNINYIKYNQLLFDCNVFPKNGIYVLENDNGEPYYDLEMIERAILKATEVSDLKHAKWGKLITGYSQVSFRDKQLTVLCEISKKETSNYKISAFSGVMSNK